MALTLAKTRRVTFAGLVSFPSERMALVTVRGTIFLLNASRILLASVSTDVQYYEKQNSASMLIWLLDDHVFANMIRVKDNSG